MQQTKEESDEEDQPQEGQDEEMIKMKEIKMRSLAQKFRHRLRRERRVEELRKQLEEDARSKAIAIPKAVPKTAVKSRPQVPPTKLANKVLPLHEIGLPNNAGQQLWNALKVKKAPVSYEERSGKIETGARRLPEGNGQGSDPPQKKSNSNSSWGNGEPPGPLVTHRSRQ